MLRRREKISRQAKNIETVGMDKKMELNGERETCRLKRNIYIHTYRFIDRQRDAD